MRNNGDIPGVTDQGACEEAGLVIDKMKDDHFDYLRGKFSDRRCASRRSPMSARRTPSPGAG